MGTYRVTQDRDINFGAKELAVMLPGVLMFRSKDKVRFRCWPSPHPACRRRPNPYGHPWQPLPVAMSTLGANEIGWSGFPSHS